MVGSGHQGLVGELRIQRLPLDLRFKLLRVEIWGGQLRQNRETVQVKGHGVQTQ